jgi:hypothetical protein
MTPATRAGAGQERGTNMLIGIIIRVVLRLLRGSRYPREYRDRDR